LYSGSRSKTGNHDDDAADDAERSGHDERQGRTRFFARGYQVFNAIQVDGYVPADFPRLPESERTARADAFFAALNIPIITCGAQAC
jgi:antirestriction protein ArdC